MHETISSSSFFISSFSSFSFSFLFLSCSHTSIFVLYIPCEGSGRCVRLDSSRPAPICRKISLAPSRQQCVRDCEYVRFIQETCSVPGWVWRDKERWLCRAWYYFVANGRIVVICHFHFHSLCQLLVWYLSPFLEVLNCMCQLYFTTLYIFPTVTLLLESWIQGTPLIGPTHHSSATELHHQYDAISILSYLILSLLTPTTHPLLFV